MGEPLDILVHMLTVESLIIMERTFWISIISLYLSISLITETTPFQGCITNT